MKKLLLLILLLPFFSFSQFDWKKGWNGNIELGTPLYNVGAHIKYGRFFSRGYVGGKVFNSSVLDGKLSLRFGANMMHQQGNFFIHQDKHNQDNHITLGLQYSFLNNKYCSLTFGLGYMRYKSVSFLSPSHYNYMNIDGA